MEALSLPATASMLPGMFNFSTQLGLRAEGLVGPEYPLFKLLTTERKLATFRAELDWADRPLERLMY